MEGRVIFAVSGTDAEAISIAKAYVREKSLTPDDVRIVKGNGVIMVMEKK